MEQKLNLDYKTKITIFCKDGSTRVVNVLGRRDAQFATQLGQDLEGTNFWQATASIL